MIRTIRDMLVGAVLSMVAASFFAWGAFNINIPQGPFLGDQSINLFTLATAINQFNQQQTTTAITATVGGGQASAAQLGFGLNSVGTSTGTNTDGVKLPPCNVGAVVYLTNDTANTITVFGSNAPGTTSATRTDTINTTAGATGVVQATVSHAIYVCAVPDPNSGKWTSIRATS